MLLIVPLTFIIVTLLKGERIQGESAQKNAKIASYLICANEYGKPTTINGEMRN